MDRLCPSRTVAEATKKLELRPEFTYKISDYLIFSSYTLTTLHIFKLRPNAKVGIMATIYSLSEKLLGHIFDYLDSPAPSASRLRRLPNLGITSSDDAFLKSISQVSKEWRSLVLPGRFKYTRVPLNHTAFTSALTLVREIQLFLDFIKGYHLSPITKSLVLAVPAVEERKYGSSYDAYKSTDCGGFWTTVFDILDPLTVTIVAPPPILGALTACSTYTGDAQAFHMPYHAFSLNYEVTSGTERMDTTFDGQSQTHMLLHARPWASVLVNEGSSLQAFVNSTTDMRPPSILNVPIVMQWQHQNLATIRSMTYVAIYPLYEHFQKVLNCFPHLEQLSVQLTLMGQDEILPNKC